MLIALCVLATLGAFGGHFWPADLGHSLAFWHHAHTWFETSVSLESLYGASAPVERVLLGHAGHTAHIVALSVSLTVASLGILIAYLIYGRGWERSQRIAGKITGALGDLYGVVKNKYYVDEAIGCAIVVDVDAKGNKRYQPDASVIGGSVSLGLALNWVDKNIVDGLVNLVGRTGRSIGVVSSHFDRVVVDGAVNGVGLMTQTFGSVVRLVQSGRIQQYATFAVFGGLMLAAWLILL